MDNTETTVRNGNSEIKFKIIEWMGNNQDASNLLKIKKELAKRILREQKKPQQF
ncbi:unnamed protein product [Paramecium pentaurelia]|uniref:Uncharacterized protein n=1 Tax=Paramecium pentaurelia TaxID=43138 RepID=A0A8S1UEY7_9CILI|nr:unnamed protein product [Paramecium pentaurelia]